VIKTNKNIFIRVWENHKKGILLLFLMILSLFFAAKSRYCRYSKQQIIQRYYAFFSFPVKKIKRLYKAEELNRKLVKEIIELSTRYQSISYIEKENSRLRALLKLKEHLPFKVLCAEVTGMQLSGIPEFVVLNKGTEENIKKDAAVVVQSGVVGRIAESHTGWSRCELLTSRTARISAMILRSRVKGIVQWEHGDVFCMKGVLKRSSVEIGDVVVTSGVSTIYPAGLFIGRVFKVTPAQDDMFKDVYLNSGVNFQTLEQVFIITTGK